MAEFYAGLALVEPLLAMVLGARAVPPGQEITAARTRKNPRLLARPIGLRIVAKVIAQLRQTLSMEETFAQLRRVPLAMSRSPFANVIWGPERGTMDSSGETLAVRLLCYMLGWSQFDERLRRRYADWFGVEPDAVKPSAGCPAAR